MGRAEFREEHFYTFLFQLRDDFAQYFQENEETWGQRILDIKDDFLSNLKTQEKTLDSIHISLLYTSFFRKTIWVQWDAYGEEGPVVGEKICSKQYAIGSIKDPLDKIMEQWLAQGEAEYLQQDITPIYLESWILECISPVFRYFITQYRYPLYHAFPQSQIQALAPGGKFYINLGELGGWGNMIYALRPNQDLAIQTPESLWNFTHYQDKTYENEIFSQLKIKWGIFRHCVFEHCQIQDFHWTDCHFDHCTFHDVQFTSGFFHGSQFHHCIFLQCTFDGVNFYQMDLEKQDSLDRYIPCSFRHCHINGCDFILCYLVEVTLEHCQISQHHCHLSVVRDSDFENLNQEVEA